MVNGMEVMHKDLAKVLYSEEQIRARVKELGKQITQVFKR